MPIRAPAPARATSVTSVDVERRAVALDAERDGGARLARWCCAATSAGERTGVAVDRDDAVAGLEPGARGGLVGDAPRRSAAGRGRLRSPSTGMKLPSQSAPARPTRQRERCAQPSRRRRARRRARPRRAPEARSRRQRRSCQLRTGSPSTADDEIAVARCPARRRGRAGRRRREQRALARDAGDVRAGEQQHREQQVGDRSGGDDRDALARRSGG